MEQFKPVHNITKVNKGRIKYNLAMVAIAWYLDLIRGRYEKVNKGRTKYNLVMFVIACYLDLIRGRYEINFRWQS